MIFLISIPQVKYLQIHQKNISVLVGYSSFSLKKYFLYLHLKLYSWVRHVWTISIANFRYKGKKKVHQKSNIYFSEKKKSAKDSVFGGSGAVSWQLSSKLVLIKATTNPNRRTLFIYGRIIYSPYSKTKYSRIVTH